MLIIKIQHLDLDEVKHALFNIDSTKTPGLDGFGIGFFLALLELHQNRFIQLCPRIF